MLGICFSRAKETWSLPAFTWERWLNINHPNKNKQSKTKPIMVSAMEERNMMGLGDSLRENSAGQGGPEGAVAMVW